MKFKSAIAILLISIAAAAQEAPAPGESRTWAWTGPDAPQPQTHKLENSLFVASIAYAAAGFALDGITTTGGSCKREVGAPWLLGTHPTPAKTALVFSSEFGLDLTFAMLARWQSGKKHHLAKAPWIDGTMHLSAGIKNLRECY